LLHAFGTHVQVHCKKKFDFFFAIFCFFMEAGAYELGSRKTMPLYENPHLNNKYAGGLTLQLPLASRLAQ
jgi:hypothetical protein